MLRVSSLAAVESLSAMEGCGDGEDCLSGLICLAAQLAFEVRQVRIICSPHRVNDQKDENSKLCMEEY